MCVCARVCVRERERARERESEREREKDRNKRKKKRKRETISCEGRRIGNRDEEKSDGMACKTGELKI